MDRGKEETVLVSVTALARPAPIQQSEVLPHTQNKLCRRQKHTLSTALSLQAWELPGREGSEKRPSGNRMFNLIAHCNRKAVISPYLLSAGLSKRRAKPHRFLCVQHSNCLLYRQ